jgi:cytochrome c553
MKSFLVSRGFLSLDCAAVALFVTSAAARAGAPEPVDYTRDVRPLLAANCLHCHGQDPTTREADLRLDQFTITADDVAGAEAVIVPGDAAASELFARITSDDPDLRMPPVGSGKELDAEQIETLRRWIEAGAEYQRHWAFVAPERPAVPPVSDSAWVRNPIDAFVLARLDREGLRPSSPAADNTLLRRLSLDLVGLPPTLDDLAEFEQNAAADPSAASMKVIDRLLASPHFGERWGRLWLDAARYADSDGFEKDKPRFVWMYRDWVVAALNADKPYDKFLVEQIAGDLLPGATQAEHVATGFLRNSMINEEGGADPEQFRMEALFDRMDAIGKAVLGLTVQCAQCHTHKYDPIEQTDYYRLFAMLNNCDEAQITTYTDAQLAEWAATEAVIARIEDELKADMPDWRKQMAAWEAQQPAAAPWTVISPSFDGSGDEKNYTLEDGSILAQGYAPTYFDTHFSIDVKAPQKITAVRLELLNDPNLPHGGPGRSIYGTCALTDFHVSSAPLAGGEEAELKVASASSATKPPGKPLDAIYDNLSGELRVTGPIAYAIDNDPLTAWTTDIGPADANKPHCAVFVLEKPLEVGAGVRLDFRLSQYHGGWNSDDNQNNNLGRFRVAITDAEKPPAEAIPPSVQAVMAIAAEQRTPEQVATVFGFWRTTVPQWAEANRRLEALRLSHPRGATQLALAERPKPRATHRLDRGDFLKPMEQVTAGVPAFLHTMDAEAPDRLDLARWLANRRSPTTARAVVNRIWQAYFGVGLVSTPEDLGTQGELPSHPELLDWLAVELMDNGWSLKHIHRLIVDSATYRQESVATPDLLDRDPDNRLLARGPRFRVDAESVRDIALATSGLLSHAMGGPSVYPPAPKFLFEPPASYGPKTWHYDTGPDKYRRAFYTFRYRSAPYPMLENFDAPRGDTACVRRVRSNTPLQALATLNESLSMECARELARHIVSKGGADAEARLQYVMRRCLAREPRGAEIAVLTRFVESQRERFDNGGVDPWPLLGAEGETKPTLPDGATPAEMAAWTALARVVLNLDETITKE